MVTNVFTYDPRYAAVMAALDGTFAGHTCWLDKVAGNNRIVYALDVPAGAGPSERRMAHRMARLARRHGLGLGLLNRLGVRILLAWIAVRSVLAPPHLRASDSRM